MAVFVFISFLNKLNYIVNSFVTRFTMAMMNPHPLKKYMQLPQIQLCRRLTLYL